METIKNYIDLWMAQYPVWFWIFSLLMGFIAMYLLMFWYFRSEPGLPAYNGPPPPARSNPHRRWIELGEALDSVDGWLNSDDVFVVDKHGDIVVGGEVRCKPGSLLGRFCKRTDEALRNEVPTVPVTGKRVMTHGKS